MDNIYFNGISLADYIEQYYIRKDKILDKIKEIKKQQDFYRENDEIYEYYAKIEVLEELLKEN